MHKSSVRKRAHLFKYENGLSHVAMWVPTDRVDEAEAIGKDPRVAEVERKLREKYGDEQ